MLSGLAKILKRDHREYDVFQIEVSSYSSLECKICPQTVFAEKWLFQNMDPALFQKIAGNFHRTKWVIFQGWGDPLENEDFSSLFQQTRQAGCLTGVVTNGFLLTETLSRQFVEEELEFIVIRLEEMPPKNEAEAPRDSELKHILDQVEGLIRYKNNRKSRKPLVKLSFSMTRLNMQILSQAIPLAARLGVDEIILKNLDYLPEDRWNILRTFYHESPTAAFQESLHEIRNLGKQMKIPVQIYPLKAEEIPVCEAMPHRNIFFSVDGAVGPCMYLRLPKKGEIPRIFMHKEYSIAPVFIGKIQEEDLTEIWNKESYRSFREIFENRLNAQRNIGSIFDAVSNRSSTLQENASPPPLPDVCRTCYKAYGI